MICELSSLFSILWPLNQACALYSPTQTRVEKALPATKRGPQLNSLTADLGYSVTLAPRIHPHPSRQASEALALTCQGDSAGLPHPPPTLPPLQREARWQVDLGKVLPALFSRWEIPAPHRAFSGSAPPSAGPSQARRGDSVSGLLEACGVGGLCPAPALASLAASRQAPCCWEPTRNQPLNMSEGRCLGGGEDSGDRG